MFYRILLSVAFVSTLILISCNQNNPNNSGSSNPIILNNLAFSIEESVYARLGEKISIDVNLHNYKDTAYELGGFDLYIAYKLNAMTFDSVSTGQMIEYCGWWYYTYRHYIDTVDRVEFGVVRIVSLSDHYFADPICLTPNDSSTNQIAQMHFSVKNDNSLRRQTIPIQFFWKDCGYNNVADLSGNDLYLSNRVISNGIDISRFDEYPNFTGYNASCDSLMESRRGNFYTIVDFVNGSVRIR